MNIHMIEEKNHIGKPKVIIEPENCQEEHKMKLINYEKKLLNEKKVTHSSKSIENIQM